MKCDNATKSNRKFGGRVVEGHAIFSNLHVAPKPLQDPAFPRFNSMTIK
jgi:hypothetical protein